MNPWTYFLQAHGQSIRKYPHGSEIGLRWTPNGWSPDCASRRSCELTHDTVITEAQALEMGVEL